MENGDRGYKVQKSLREHLLNNIFVSHFTMIFNNLSYEYFAVIWCTLTPKDFDGGVRVLYFSKFLILLCT